MFDLSWAHLLVLLVAALFILGPERLPQAAAWLGKTVRKMREFGQNAQRQLQQEMGPEFDEFRKPLEDLRRLREFDPRRAITQHLFDGDPDPLGLAATSDGSSSRVNGRAAAPARPKQGSATDPDAR